MLQRVKICSVFVLRSMPIDYLLLVYLLCKNSGPGGEVGAAGTHWGGGLSDLAAETGLFSGSPVKQKSLACVRAGNTQNLRVAGAATVRHVCFVCKV